MYKDNFCNLDNVNVRYWRAGDDTASTIILLHGIGGSVETWETLMPFLSTRFQVYAFDFCGFGKSDKPDIRYSRILLSNLLKKFIEFQQIEKFSIIGHSMGGGVALHYLLENNEKQVEKMVLINSAGLGMPSLWFRLAAHPLLSPMINSRLSNKYFGKTFFRKIYGTHLSDITIQKLSEFWKDKAVLNSYISYMNSIDQNEICSNLEKIQQPCLILWGENDKILAANQGLLAKSELKNSKLYILPQGKHSVHTELPQIVNPLIMEFLVNGL